MPRLTDTGRAVTLDLHGATVDDGLDLARRVVRIASERGRSSVRIVHGASTSSRAYRNRTLKHALHRLADDGDWPARVTSALRRDGEIVLGLPLGARTDPTRITLADVL